MWLAEKGLAMVKVWMRPPDGAAGNFALPQEVELPAGVALKSSSGAILVFKDQSFSIDSTIGVFSEANVYGAAVTG